MHKRSRLFALLLALLTVFSLTGTALAAEKAERTGAAASAGDYEQIQAGIQKNGISKYGNVTLNIAGTVLLEAGYEYGDILTVTVGGAAHDMPFCTNYADVDNGSLVLRHNAGTDSLEIAINMGDFASASGLGTKITAEDGTVSWQYEASTAVTVSMKEKAGYLAEYEIRQLERTNERADYASDAVFANFRNVAMGSLGRNALYRSSSPVDNDLGRAAYADDLMAAAGVRSVLNLANSGEDIQAWITADDFDSPYYASLYREGSVKALNLGVDFKAEDFGAGLAEGLRFLAAADGPYLVHCTEGKDRAGFVSALLECLMGASYQEIVADYMLTYENYYHVEKDSAQYNAIASSNIVQTLTFLAGEDAARADLSAAAERYLNGIGMTAEEIAAVKAGLSRDYEKELPPIATLTAPDGTIYYRMRDVAFALKGTEDAFGISWTPEAGIVITTGGVYDAEPLEPAGEGTPAAAIITVTLDGKAVRLSTLNLQNNNYMTEEAFVSVLGVEIPKWDAPLLTHEEYLATTNNPWFATRKLAYAVQGKMVSRDTAVYNPFEDVHYTATPNGEDVILKGTADEEWVGKLAKVIKTYVLASGKDITAADFPADTWVDLKTIPEAGYFACFVPANTKVAVQTAWGDILQCNRDGVEHGDGDYLICRAGEDGKPDLSDVWVVNGVLFPATYDMSGLAAS